ncbi:MAG: hypothetical protein NTU98_06825 [Bacteroidetes bacterium]|nr:hypothetical protein [Bacteroidota bacterium]
MKRFIVPAFLFLVTIGLTGCHNKADLSVAPPFPDVATSHSCSPDTVYFQNTVLPLIIYSCAKSGCHGQGSSEGDFTLESYSTIMQIVTPGAPTASKLYTTLFAEGDKHMPRKGKFTVNEDGIIYYWILKGALDNRCEPAGCDSSNVTYTATIGPIVNSWCTGCHGTSNPSNGLDLTTYDQVKASVNGGRLMGAIQQDYGYYPMPKGSHLSSCEISLFQIWVRLGMPQ